MSKGPKSIDQTNLEKQEQLLKEAPYHKTDSETVAVVDDESPDLNVEDNTLDNLGVDSDNLTDNQIDVLRKAATYPDKTAYQLADLAEISVGGSSVNDTLKKYWPERLREPAPTKISEKDCKEIRTRLLDGDDAASLADVFDVSSTTVREHAKGRCSHDVNSPPVEYNDMKWAIAGANQSKGEWVDVYEVDLDTLDKLNIEYETRRQVRVKEGPPR